MRNDDAGNEDELSSEPTRKATLGDIMEDVRRADDDLLTTEVDLEALGRDLRTKIDDIAAYLEKLKAEAERAAANEKLFARRKEILQNKAKRLKEYVAQQMIFDADLRFNEHGIRDEKPRIAGNKFEVQLRYHESVEIKQITGEANSTFYMHFGPAYVRRNYDWDKKTLKKVLHALKNGDTEGLDADLKKPLEKYATELLASATIKRTPHVKINPK